MGWEALPVVQDRLAGPPVASERLGKPSLRSGMGQ